MSRGTKASISRSALQHNYQRVRQMAPGSKIWTVVKANGYGHCAEFVVDALVHSDGFAVSSFAEAVELREQGIRNPIILLEGVTEPEHLRLAQTMALTCVFHCSEQLEHLGALNDDIPLQVWLKVDTGMHRLGFSPALVPQVREQLRKFTGVSLVGIMTHLACADNPDDFAFTELQVSRFAEILIPEDTVSIANSAAICRYPQLHKQWVRPGIMLYGASPLADVSADQLELRPAMTLSSPVISLRTIAAGETVGYGGRWRATRETRVAVLAIGYGDGYPRHAPDGTPVWLNGQRVPLIGRVSMDMVMIDVTDLATVSVGDIAELWGANLPVDEVAQVLGTIGYELLTRVSPRVERELID